MQLQTTDDKVKAAAAKCPQAAEVLKVLFPEAFEEKEVEFPIFPAIKTIDGKRLIENRRCSINVVWLGNEFNWQIKEVKEGGYELIPTRK